MAFAKKREEDLTVHWNDDGLTSVCGQATPLIFRGRAVTSLVENTDKVSRCGRCDRALQSQKRKVLEAIQTFTRVH